METKIRNFYRTFIEFRETVKSLTVTAGYATH